MVRRAERLARKKLPAGVEPDGAGIWYDMEKNGLPDMRFAVNKCARWLEEDLTRRELAVLVQDIEALKQEMREKNVRFTNTAATFLSRMFYPRSERTKLWENVWTIHHSGVRPGHRALDVGGASTPFSFYLAKMGCAVTVLDNDWGNCGTIYNANDAARKMKWDLKAIDSDIAKPFPLPSNSFDRVFSICTIEHLSSPVRRFMMREIGRVLKPGGIAALTMCYDPNHEVLLVDKGLRFGYREKLEKDVLTPSGLKIYGNTDLLDFDPNAEFLGAVFLEK